MASQSQRRDPPAGMSWDQMNRASLSAEREDYRSTTPGQRIERMLEFIRQTSSLAARGRERGRGSR